MSWMAPVRVRVFSTFKPSRLVREYFEPEARITPKRITIPGHTFDRETGREILRKELRLYANYRYEATLL